MGTNMGVIKTNSINELVNSCKLGFQIPCSLQVLRIVNYSFRIQLSISNTFNNSILATNSMAYHTASKCLFPPSVK